MAQAFAFFIIAEAISAAISFLFPAEGPRLKDLSVSASSYGNPIPQAYGTMRVASNMIWANPIQEHKSTQKAGLGSFYKQYTYTVDMALALCYGPVQSIRRIWANGKLIFDATGASPSVNNGKYLYTFYDGTEDQLPDPAIQASVGASNAPAYRGICYIVFTQFLLTDFGNQIPQISVELYAGPAQATPYTDLTNDGSARLTGYGNASPYAVDFDRGVMYIYDPTTYTISTVSTTTGIKTGSANPILAPEDIWDSGHLSAVWDISYYGEVFVTMGQQNLSRYARLEPSSLNVISTISHAIPGDSYPAYNPPLSPPFIPAANQVYYDTAGMNALIVSYRGECWYTDLTLSPALTNIIGTFGDLYTLRVFCPIDQGFWAMLIGGSIFDTSNTLTLKFVSELAFLDDSYQDYVLENPDAGIGSTGMLPIAVVMDTDTSSVIMFFSCKHTDNTYAAKYTRDTRSVIWQVKIPEGFSDNDYRARRLESNQVAWVSGTKLFIMDTSDGSFVNLTPAGAQLAPGVFGLIEEIVGLHYNPGESGYTLPSGTAQGGVFYDGRSGNMISLGGNGDVPRIIRVGYFANVAVDLQFILESMLLQAGLLPDQFDMSALAAVSVNGYGFAQMTDLKSVIEELTQVFLFDIVERDGKLVAVVRGGTDSVETISYKALSAQGNNEPDKANFWKETRLSEADLPAQISLTYYNLEQDFETSTATSKRIFAPVPTMFSRQQEGVEATISFHPDDAKDRANAMLYTTWAERTKHETRIPLAYAYLDPTDLITVNLADGRSYFERILQMEMGADYCSNMNTSGQDSGVYSFDLTADGGNGFTQTVQPPQPARMFVFNTPYLRDTDTSGDGSVSVYYTGVANLGGYAFEGATTFIAVDNSNYQVLDIVENDVEWGILSGTLASPSHGCFALDWGNTITIYPSVSWFALETITDDQLWAGGNMCIVGDEVISFRDAVQNTDGSWTISNLLRGLRGTEWACDSHIANEPFVFLSTSTIQIEQKQIDAGGQDFWYKAVGTGTSLSSAIALEIEYEPRDLMPYAPAQLAAAWSGGDISISFSRRTRYGGNMTDGTGTVPLHETQEAYEVDIYDGDTVVRTLSVNNGATPVDFPSVTYPAADIVADFTDPLTTVTVEVYQLGITGRGFGTKATLTISGTPSPTARYWGASALTSLAESDILALSNEDISNDFDNTVSYNCTGGKYPYFCFPQTFGTPSAVLVNSLPFSDFSVAVVSVGGNNYNVLKFNNIQHGSAIPVVWK